jgi:hypothetical protein
MRDRDGHGRFGKGGDGALSVSILADPSGAFTTAAAIVPAWSGSCDIITDTARRGCVVVFGGTDPSHRHGHHVPAGAHLTLVDYLSIDAALSKASEQPGAYEPRERGCSDADIARLVSRQDVDLTAKAGVQVLSASVLEDASQLKVAADITRGRLQASKASIQRQRLPHNTRQLRRSRECRAADHRQSQERYQQALPGRCRNGNRSTSISARHPHRAPIGGARATRRWFAEFRRRGA